MRGDAWQPDFYLTVTASKKRPLERETQPKSGQVGAAILWEAVTNGCSSAADQDIDLICNRTSVRDSRLQWADFKVDWFA